MGHVRKRGSFVDAMALQKYGDVVLLDVEKVWVQVDDTRYQRAAAKGRLARGGFFENKERFDRRFIKAFDCFVGRLLDDTKKLFVH